MGMDWGVRRIGLSVSDPTQLLARPLTILVRSGPDLALGPEDDAVLQSLAVLIREHGVSGLVFGVPYYHLSGDPNQRVSCYLETGQTLGARLSLPLAYYDEGQTSERARELKPKKSRNLHRRESIDDLAATILLQGYLDAHTLVGSADGMDERPAESSVERSASGR